MPEGGPQPASPWVTRFLPGVAKGGSVLDIACGKGRHLRLAHAHGHPVIGIDRTLAGVADLEGQRSITLIEADLEVGQPLPIDGQTFAGVIVTNYLWRPILPAIVAAVADDGVLIYETFGIGNARYGRPSNPDFLLQPGELLTVAAPRLTPVAFEDVTLDNPPRAVQRIAAVGPSHRWLTDPPRAIS